MNTYNKLQHNLFLAISCLGIVLVMVACQQEGSAEKTGKKIDQTTEKAEKQLENVKSEVSGEAKEVKESVAAHTQIVGEYVDDSVITAKIKEAIIADEYLKVSQIQVTTDKGVVTLSGAVDSEQLIARAIGLANSQKHVKSVQNNLTLKVNAAAK